MTAVMTVTRYTFTGICIALVLSVLALVYFLLTLDRDRPDVLLPVDDSRVISDGSTFPVGIELRKALEEGGYETLVAVREDGHVKLANIDGAPQAPCLLNGQIIGIGGCKPDDGSSHESGQGNEASVTAPEAALLVYASSSSFCVTVGGIRRHGTADPNPSAPANWAVGNRPCSNIEATANYQVHNHQ